MAFKGGRLAGTGGRGTGFVGVAGEEEDEASRELLPAAAVLGRGDATARPSAEARDAEDGDESAGEAVAAAEDEVWAGDSGKRSAGAAAADGSVSRRRRFRT